MTQLVRFAHNTKSPNLRYSIAYNFEKNGDTLTVNYGIAQCALGDSFSRAQGRELAEMRLASKADATNGVYAGQFTISDYPGLNVSKLIGQRFEAMRNIRHRPRRK